jgi:hypothetical protein
VSKEDKGAFTSIKVKMVTEEEKERMVEKFDPRNSLKLSAKISDKKLDKNKSILKNGPLADSSSPLE